MKQQPTIWIAGAALTALAVFVATAGGHQNALQPGSDQPSSQQTDRLDAARNIVAAVNAKNSKQYVRDLADEVVVSMYQGAVRLRGKNAVQDNRANHFRNYPEARNVLIHLVAIDNRVIMHDQVWLTAEQKDPADIVEVFTFENGKIARIDVIQPADLF
ncbi:MAG: nuclear transport factor 2 family protein [Pseudomonadota bacterium]